MRQGGPKSKPPEGDAAPGHGLGGALGNAVRRAERLVERARFSPPLERPARRGATRPRPLPGLLLKIVEGGRVGKKKDSCLSGLKGLACSCSLPSLAVLSRTAASIFSPRFRGKT